MQTTQGDRSELRELLEEYRTALLTTRGPDGHFHSRPMAVKRVEGDGEYWLATRLDTRKVEDLEAEPRCGLAFHDGGRSPTYVSMSGTVDVVRDRATIRSVWAPTWRAWFPKGPDEEDLVLLHFRPDWAEYVHPRTGRLQVLTTRLKAALHREPEEVAPKKEPELPH